MRRVLFVLLALVFAGCASDDAGTEPTDSPEPTPSGSDPGPAPEAIVEVLNDTASQGLPGGAGSLEFEVPAGYMELFLTGRDGKVLRGDVTLTLTSPSGEATEIQSGLVVHDDSGSSPSPCACEWRINNPEAGMWTLSWEVQGEMTLPLRGLVQ